MRLSLWSAPLAVGYLLTTMLFSHDQREKVKNVSIDTHMNAKLTKLDILWLSLICCPPPLRIRYKARDTIYRLIIFNSRFPMTQRLLKTLVINFSNQFWTCFFL